MTTGRLLGISLDVATSPTFRLKIPAATRTPTSWGVASYPDDDAAAGGTKEPSEQRRETILLQPTTGPVYSTVFVVHSAPVARRTTRQDAPPFARTYGRRDIIFAHSGDLESPFRRHLSIPENAPFQSVGRTDSEHLFCWLLNEMYQANFPRLADVEPQSIFEWLHRINQAGSLNCLISDGTDLIAYRDAGSHGSVFQTPWLPPRVSQRLDIGDIAIDLEDPRHASRTAMLFSSEPVVGSASTLLNPGQVAVARRGRIQGKSLAGDSASPTQADQPVEMDPVPVGDPSRQIFMPMTTDLAQGGFINQGTSMASSSSTPATRVLRVNHETVYTYTEPVIGSVHILRLQPVHDEDQEVMSFALNISPPSVGRDFEDVFGNRAAVLDLLDAYSEFRVGMEAVVRITQPSDDLSIRGRASLPLVWMPWQRQMMHAYLLPPELPETQLQELSAYAMSFVTRQANDVVLTLRDINTTIYREFKYISGSTTVETTPFDVYVNRRGVCQDFANLFICLARLLSVPARYCVGYIYTGGNYENKIQSDASHAWAEVYLPTVGWRGFDPTNGTETGLDHVRVAVGRNYRDATPTSGTIFQGGGTETLSVTVKVTEEPTPM